MPKLLKFKQQVQWCSLAEGIWVTVFNINMKIHLCCGYIPPETRNINYENHLYKVSEIMSLNTTDTYLISGGYNLPFINLTRNNLTHCEPNFLRRSATNLNLIITLTMNNLEQYNNNYNMNSKILDIILSNRKN